MMMMMGETADIAIVYDGECPVCSAYIRMLRLRTLGEVALINAREDHPLVRSLQASKVDLDEGMAVKIGDELYLGDQAVQRLALLTGPSSVFNRINFWIFKNAARSRLLYPMLRAGRRLLLTMLGRKTIAGDRNAGLL